MIGLKGTGTSGFLLSSQPLSWIYFCLQHGGPNIFWAVFGDQSTRIRSCCWKAYPPSGSLCRSLVCSMCRNSTGGTIRADPAYPTYLSPVLGGEIKDRFPYHHIQSRKILLSYRLSSLSGWVSFGNKDRFLCQRGCISPGVHGGLVKRSRCSKDKWSVRLRRQLRWRSTGV